MARTRKAAPQQFDEATRARLFERVVDAAADNRASIGGMERLAGVEQDDASRAAFWKPFDHLARGQDVQPYFDAAMAECRRRIATRIEWVAL